MEKVLLGCPNLECLELDKVLGICRLEINFVKLRKLIITNNRKINFKPMHLLEVFAPYIQHLKLLGFCHDETHLKLRNVSSLVTAVFSLNVDFVELRDENDRFHKQREYRQELLQSIAHVKNLELGHLGFLFFFFFFSVCNLLFVIGFIGITLIQQWQVIETGLLNNISYDKNCENKEFM